MSFTVVHVGPGYTVVQDEKGYFYYRRDQSPIHHGPYRDLYHAAEAFKLSGAGNYVSPCAYLFRISATFSLFSFAE